MATSPPTLTGSAVLPSNSSPGLLVRELKLLVRITGIVVPAGTTIGLGASASLFLELGALVGEPAGPPPAVVLVSVPGFVAVPLFPQPAIVNNPATIPHNAHCFFMNFSPLRKIF